MVPFWYGISLSDQIENALEVHKTRLVELKAPFLSFDVTKGFFTSYVSGNLMSSLNCMSRHYRFTEWVRNPFNCEAEISNGSCFGLRGTLQVMGASFFVMHLFFVMRWHITISRWCIMKKNRCITRICGV